MNLATFTTLLTIHMGLLVITALLWWLYYFFTHFKVWTWMVTYTLFMVGVSLLGRWS